RQAPWNVAAGAFRTAPLSLVDGSGAATAASVTWLANGVWTLPIGDAPGDARMMRGYLDTSSTSQTTVTVSGLRAGSDDVYVYVDGDNKTYTRAAAYRLTAAGSDTVVGATDTGNANFDGTFTQASGTPGNYDKFAITGDGFTLVATPVSGTNAPLRAPVNAIQIVPRERDPATVKGPTRRERQRRGMTPRGRSSIQRFGAVIPNQAARAAFSFSRGVWGRGVSPTAGSGNS